MRTLVWFRGKDLRVADHRPLSISSDGETLAVFVLDPYFFEPARARRNSNRIRYLLESLEVLRASLRDLGIPLLIAEGRSVEVIVELTRRLQVDRVVAEAWSEPIGRERDRRIGEALGARLELTEGATLLPLGSVTQAKGRPYSVFTAFARAARPHLSAATPLGVPRLRALEVSPSSLPSWASFDRALPTASSLGLDTSARLPEAGEHHAKERLRRFLEGPLESYSEGRDRMDWTATSGLSQDLKFGTLSVTTAYAGARDARPTGQRLGDDGGARRFQDQLLWREFAHHLLAARPELLSRPFRADFEGFPWPFDPATQEAHLRLWKSGHTGYPIVDAAARQLLAFGWVHNRARMIAASFLTKHLGIHYAAGEAHYLEHLVDGDWASNNLGWQWSAGSGCDAQPYFRVFNPVTQAEKFDPEGRTIHAHVPELRGLPAPYVFAPWQAPKEVLLRAGVRLGESYPLPIVEHTFGRDRFLRIAAEHLKSKKHEAGLSR